nr:MULTISPECIES: hypothetical protein [unclassified Paenibacillus]
MNWFPWSEEVIESLNAITKGVFLSNGYS